VGREFKNMSVARKAGVIVGCTLAVFFLAHGTLSLIFRERDPLSDMDDAALARYLENQAAREIEANRSKTCPRPVLRGEPLPGPAAPDMVAVVEGTPEFEACLKTPDNDSFTRFYDRFLVTGDKPSEGLPERRLSYVSTAVFPEITGDMKTACIPWIARLRQATRHEDACSPYRFGVRDFHVVRQYENSRHGLGKVLAVAASEWEAGDKRETMGLMLDTLRFFQDLQRGGVAWIQARMSSFMGTLPTVSVMEWMLNQPSLVGQELLSNASHELDALIASQPRVSSVVLGDLRELSLMYEYGDLHKRQWPWPAEWGPVQGASKKPWLLLRPAHVNEDARADLRIKRAFEEIERAYRTTCRETDTPLQCREESAKYREQVGQPETGRARRILWLLVAPFLGESKETAVQKEIERRVLQGTEIDLGAFSRWGLSTFPLSALRLLVDYRLLAEQTGTCPDPDALRRAAGRGHLVDPCSGQEIVIRKVSATRLFIEPPHVPGCETDGHERPILIADCPFATSP
jgi:hypothetical protein